MCAPRNAPRKRPAIWIVSVAGPCRRESKEDIKENYYDSKFRGVEHRDVTPDDIRLPTAEDLAAGRDTVLSYAASLVGVKVDPVEAGKLFPIVRPKK